MANDLQVSGGPAPLLTIDTYVPQRQPVSIDGVVYEMRPLSEFGVIQRHEITRVWQTYYDLLERLKQGDLLSPDEALLADQSLDRLLRAALPDVPAAVLARVDSVHREALALLFFQLTEDAETTRVASLQAHRSRTSTGAKKSRASGASTARRVGT